MTPKPAPENIYNQESPPDVSAWYWIRKGDDAAGPAVWDAEYRVFVIAHSCFPVAVLRTRGCTWRLMKDQGE